MFVKIITEAELFLELQVLPPKLGYRLNAKTAGWRVPNFEVLEFVQIPRSESISQQLDLLRLPSKFATDQVHVLILQGPNVNKNEKTRRWFQSTNLLNDLLLDISKSKPCRVLITEVVPPVLSGISCWQNGEAVIEVAFGQMIAKGNIETSHYRFHENTLVKTQEYTQKYCNEIKNGEIITREINLKPHLELAQLTEVLQNTRNMIQQTSQPLTIEWFITKSNEIIYLDAMEEQVFSFNNLNNSQGSNQGVYLDNSDLTRLNAEQPIIISPGMARGRIQKVDSQKLGNDSLNLHYLDFANAKDDSTASTENVIYCCDSPKLEYISLLGSAAGFIFAFGGSLSHLANLIRARKLPACIDAALHDQIKTTISPVLFHCGETFSTKITSQGHQYAKYQNKLITTPVISPILSPHKDFTVTSLGWKALNLNLMQVTGFSVPRTIFIPGDIGNSEALKNLFDSYSTIFEIQEGQVYSKKFPEAIHDIFPCFGHDPDYHLICRSSSTHEDGFQDSAAGIFDSIPDLADLSQLHAAILKVMDYSASPRFQQYCHSAQIDPTSVQMGVILQEYISPKFSGVLFTRSCFQGPNNNLKQIFIELAYHNSDGVTSGNEDPLRFILAEGWESEEQLLGSLKRDASQWPPFLNHQFPFVIFMKFINSCNDLTKTLDVPLDVEFIIDPKDHIWFTQCRPVLLIG